MSAPRTLGCLGVAVGLLLALPAAAAPGWRWVLTGADAAPPPWPRRIAPKPDRPWAGLLEAPEAWPAEPRAPDRVDADRFARALRRLCGRRPRPETIRQYSRWILRYSRLHDVDPFLAAAVIYRRSRCGRLRPGKRGIGLARISWRTHARHLRDGWYRYWTRDGTRWAPNQLLANLFPFTRRALRHPRPNIYFLTALLHVYERQCRSLDSVVTGRPHRHFVSHLRWGDRVLGARFEDLALQARRRLLRLYRGPPAIDRPPRLRGVALVSPLDGVPRALSGFYGDPRPGGRRHRGIDFVSTHGEPVRAVAAGEVVFAGLQQRGRHASDLSPGRAGRVSRRRMGRGGLFVLVDHGHGVTSGYFHLARYTIRSGARVEAGQIIGFVGTTGIHESPPHLHFELRLRGWRLDPARWLRRYLVPPHRPRPRRTPEA